MTIQVLHDKQGTISLSKGLFWMSQSLFAPSRVIFGTSHAV